MPIPMREDERNMLSKLYRDEEGLTTVEYALLLALLVVAAITVWTTFGARVRTSVSGSTDAFNQASNGG